MYFCHALNERNLQNITSGPYSRVSADWVIGDNTNHFIIFYLIFSVKAFINGSSA